MSTPTAAPVASSVDEVVALYRRWGAEHYDEELSQIDHAVQTAALARADGASDELVVAALLHDVGHLLELAGRSGHGDLPDEDLAHEAAGVFGAGVTAPVALHVRAKRYRSAVDADYLAALSAGSLRSLVMQGGPADADEVASFERNPGFADAVRLRGWDDGGKVDGLHVPELDDYLDLLRGLARS